MRRLASIVGIAIVACLVSAVCSLPVHGWAGMPFGVYDLHAHMTQDTLEGARSEKLLSFSDNEINWIAKQSNAVDSTEAGPHHRVTYYDNLFKLYKGKPYLDPEQEGAERWASNWISTARSLYAADDTVNAGTALGYAIHYIQDAVCPPHVFPFEMKKLGGAHFDFERKTWEWYAYRDWPSIVASATPISISSAEDLRLKVTEAADYVYKNLTCTFRAPDKKVYLKEPGSGMVSVDPPEDFDGWDMTDDDIGLAMERAAALVKGAAIWALSGTPSRNVAVTPPYWDQMQDVLDVMGYEYTEIPLVTLTDLIALQAYDVVFLNCAPVYQPVGDTFGPIREFVSQGGAVYASDFAFEYIEGAFPDYADFGGHIGPGQTTTGNILDEGLKAYIGVETMPIVYDLGGWVPITYVSGDVTTFVSNTVSYDGVTHPDTPAVIGFRYGKGYVVYTSFHHAAQDALARKLMEYLVLIPLTADINAQLESMITEKGYCVDATYADAVDEGETKSYGYLVTATTNLIFGVNWYGSEVTLSVVCPDGTTYDTRSSSTPPLLIQVFGATPGLWTIMATGTQLPYPQYAIVLMVGTTSAPIVPATADFKPDVLNLAAPRQVVTVYIELPEGYDVEVIDVASIMLNGTVAAEEWPATIGDYNNNGIPDLMVKFDGTAVQDVIAVGESVEITVTGEIDGIQLMGTDTIRVIGP